MGGIKKNVAEAEEAYDKAYAEACKVYNKVRGYEAFDKAYETCTEAYETCIEAYSKKWSKKNEN